MVETIDFSSLIRLSVWPKDRASDLGTWLAIGLPIFIDVRIKNIYKNSWFCYTVDLIGFTF